jgi:AmmeMemoRadiSam system protein B
LATDIWIYQFDQRVYPMKMRACAVAGMFYPREPNHLEQLLTRFFAAAGEPVGALGIVAPHAGYIYSGEVAAQAYAAIPPDFSGTFVVIGPSHRGYMTAASSVSWETPLGVIDTDTAFVEALDIETDEFSHADEHSLEVQMPFIKFRFPRARVAPVMMGGQDEASSANIGRKITAATGATRRDVRVVASSDFSHYVPEALARENDLYAIESLQSLNTGEFFSRIHERKVSACGYGPIAAMVEACRAMGATQGRLLKYATSGDVTGDRAEVVGYAAIAVI